MIMQTQQQEESHTGLEMVSINSPFLALYDFLLVTWTHLMNEFHKRNITEQFHIISKEKFKGASTNRRLTGMIWFCLA